MATRTALDGHPDRTTVRGQLVEVCRNSNASSSQTFSELFLLSDGRRWTAAHIGS